jgi:DNA-binding MarR family transcriptional regulator
MFMAAPCGAFDHEKASMSIASSKPRFTDKQGQYLAFIHTYVLLHRRPPAEADMQSYFGVTPPSVHRMVVELEKRGLIRRLPRQARSIAVCIPADEIPQLRPQPIETSASRY